MGENIMYTDEKGREVEVEKITKRIDQSDLTTWQRDFISCNILEVEAGTTGYCGGDSGSGSRTYLRIKDQGGTDMRVRTKRARYSPCPDQAEEIEIVLGGDTELETMKEALRWMLSILESQSEQK